MSAYLTELRAQIGPRKVILAYATALIRDWRGRILFQRASRYGRAYLSETGELTLSQYQIMADRNARPPR